MSKQAMRDLTTTSQAAGGPVLVFAPEAAVTLFYVGHLAVVQAMRQANQEVLVAKCSGSLRTCPPMGMVTIRHEDERKKSLCEQCKAISCKLLEAYNVPGVDIGLYIDQSEVEAVFRELEGLDAEALSNYSRYGYVFGSMAYYDVAIEIKKYHPRDVIGEEFQLWRNQIVTAVTLYSALRRMIKERNLSRVITYNQYANCAAVQLAAKDEGIPFFTMYHSSHLSGDMRRLVVIPNGSDRDVALRNFISWPKWRRLAMPVEDISDITDDLIMKMHGLGSHVFSSKRLETPTALKKRLGIAEDGKKVVVAFTSSLDELTGDEYIVKAWHAKQPMEHVFESQVEWLQTLTRWAQDRNDVHLVIRVHPREAATGKGYQCAATHLEQLRSNLDDSHPNVTIVWAEDATSSYDLAEIADLATVAWSSIGLELARMGIPVVRASRGNFALYPDDSKYPYYDDAIGYMAGIERRLAEGADLESVEVAYKWYRLAHMNTAVMLNEHSPTSTFTSIPAPRTSEQYDTLAEIILNESYPADLAYRKNLPNRSRQHQQLQLMAMLSSMNRIFLYIISGTDCGKPLSLDFPLHACPWGNGDGQVSKSADGCYELSIGEHRFKRNSPLLEKLEKVILEGYQGLLESRTDNETSREQLSA